MVRSELSGYVNRRALELRSETRTTSCSVNEAAVPSSGTWWNSQKPELLQLSSVIVVIVIATVRVQVQLSVKPEQ